MLYGPRGLMCCECAEWERCLVSLFHSFATMKTIRVYKEEGFTEAFTEVKCEHYKKESANE